MSSITQNQINRLTAEIANLQIFYASEGEKEASYLLKINRDKEAISKSKSNSIRQSKARAVAHTQRELNKVRTKKAKLFKRISEKEKKLAICEKRQLEEDRREFKRQSSDLEKRLGGKNEQNIQRIVSEVPSQEKIQSIDPETSESVSAQSKNYDFFISHASEDKDSLVRELAIALRAEGAKVWFDEFVLKVGDSLSRKIDKGLYQSRYGIVVISKNFFAKEWPQKELDGLVSLEVDGKSRILPIWHQIRKAEIMQYSPTLADKVALNTSIHSMQQIVSELIQLISEEE